MKRIVFILFALACLVLPASFAGAATPVYLHDSYPASDSYTLVSAVTATGSGAARVFIYKGQTMPVSRHMCTATWSGTVPTNIVFSVDGSQNGTDFGALATVTMTASPTVLHIDKPGVVYVRGTYTSKADGDTDTSLSLTCTSGGD